MTGDEQRLSGEQVELVAVGASVGVGCHPCVRHHLKAATEAGVGEQRLVAALASSDRVAAEAGERMVAHARGVLGVEPGASAQAESSLDDALASFGAALGANDKVAIEQQMLAAQAAGASRSELEQAIQTAAKVQENAARIHVREAERLLEQATAKSDEPSGEDGCGDDCPCHAEEDTNTQTDADTGCGESAVATVG